MRVLILYSIGVGALAFGFYEFWRDGIVDKNAFTAGAMCTMAAAGLQVARDLWDKLNRTRRRR